MSSKAPGGVLCLIVTIMIAAGLGAETASAQGDTVRTATPASGRVLTLNDAVGIAVQRNIQAIQARNRMEGSDADVRAAYGGLLPSLSASGSFSRQQNWTAGGIRIQNDVPVQYPPGFTAYNNYSAGFSSRLTLFDGFANTSDISRANASAAATSHNAKRTEQTVILQTHILFWNIARAFQLRNVADDNLKRSRRQLERITESNKVGAVALADVYRQQVQAGNDELALIEAESNYQLAKADLIAYLGVEYDESAFTVDVSGFPSDIDTAEFAGLNARYGDFGGLVSTALDQRPDHLAAAEVADAASSSVTIARSGHLPSVAADGSYGWSNSELENLTDDRTLSLRLGVSLPIFNGWQTSNAVQQAQVQEMNAREDLAQSERQIAVDVRKALLTLEQAEKKIIVNKTSVVSAEMDRKIAEEKYNLGAGTLLDMLVATANYTNAMSGKVNSIFDYLLAKKSMEYALGAITQ